MAVTFLWELQGSTPTEIDYDADDILRFSGAAFADAVIVGGYNDSTHVKTSIGGDKSSANTPRNNKFISQAGGTGGDSQADWGGGTEDLDQITTAEAALKITITEGVNVTVTDAIIYSYDGITPATPTSGMTIQMAEVGDTNFAQPAGSGAALALTDSSTPATSHDFFIVISKSPTTVNLKTDTIRFEGVIQ